MHHIGCAHRHKSIFFVILIGTSVSGTESLVLPIPSRKKVKPKATPKKTHSNSLQFGFNKGACCETLLISRNSYTYEYGYWIFLRNKRLAKNPESKEKVVSY